MTTIAAGASDSVTLAQGSTLKTTGTGTAVLGPGPQANMQIGLQGANAIGPFPRDQVIYISATTQVAYSTNTNDKALPLARVGSDSSGNPAIFDETGKGFLINQQSEKPILVIGGDHAYAQWWGTNGRNGLAAMYLDRGLKPYIAINPFNAEKYDFLTWDQTRKLAQRGVEMVSHGGRHIQWWNRLNTGINVQYVGTGATATLQITSTTVIGLVNASGVDPDSFSFSTVSGSAYDTLAKLAAAIQAVGGGKWTCWLAPELTGNEPSAKLLTIAAQDVKTAERKFCAGGGITIHLQGNTFEQAYIKRSGSILEIYCDGVRLVSYDLTLTANNTLVKVVALINAAISGALAKLCDNGKGEPGSSAFESYLSGDEDSTNLLPTANLPCVESYAMLEAGLSHYYMLDRQLQLAKDQAAAQGVDFVNFSQSGDGFYPWLVAGHAQHKSYRGNAYTGYITPYGTPAKDMRPVFRLHKAITSNYNANHSKAIIDALIDSGAYHVEMLIHKILPDGTSGYSLPNYDSYYDQTESNMVALLDYVKAKKDAGLVDVLTPEEARMQLQYRAAPLNRIFNPKFKNSGDSLLVNETGAHVGMIMPGWQLQSGTVPNAVSVASGAMTVTSASSTSFVICQQQMRLEPGKTYEAGVFVDVKSYTSGAGVSLSTSRRRGAWKGANGPTVAGFSSERVTSSRLLRTTFTAPNHDPYSPAKVRSNVAQPWNLSANTNIQLNIDGLGAIDNLNCATGAAVNTAVTAKEIAAAINAAIAADSRYPAEYHTCARAVSGRVIVQAPYHQLNETFTVSITAATTTSATLAIFGAATNIACPQNSQSAGVEDFPIMLQLNMAMIGTVVLSDPYLREINYGN